MSGGSGTGGMPAYLDLDALEDALVALIERPRVQAAIVAAIGGHAVTPAQLEAAFSEARERARKGAVAYLADTMRRGDPDLPRERAP